MLSKRIVGAWQLVSYTVQSTRDDAPIYPMGADAVGLIVYTHDRYMSAQIMRRERSRASSSSADTQDYLAYGGPYRVEEDVIHHDVAVSLLPHWLHTTQLRRGTLDGDRLTLLADVPAGEVTIRATLVWARAEAP
ncbi:lipocalin-like domain-containing protein [Mycobacterium camsae]|uniref:lipocalin-like domain-containing protein n=1 Tax=Mycobacterium gordonae TaxID=1778 RepID=UPI00197F5B7E|nr:lipocalin-like domain-containing protein [Mycobacterium gordonae]